MARLNVPYEEPKPPPQRWPTARSVAWVLLVAAVAFWATLLIAP